MNKLLIFIASTWLFLLSCNKPATVYNPDFEGKWRSEVFDTIKGKAVRNEIEISGKDGVYRSNCGTICEPKLCDCIVEQNGKVVVNTGRTHIKFGSANSYPLKIDEEPKMDSLNKFKMKIDGIVYIKQ